MDYTPVFANNLERGRKIMKKTLCSILSVLTLALCLGGIAAAQEITGSIVGTVKDSAGAPIAGATVTVTDPAKNNAVVRTVCTPDDGKFSVSDNTISPYTDTIAATK